MSFLHQIEQEVVNNIPINNEHTVCASAKISSLLVNVYILVGVSVAMERTIFFAEEEVAGTNPWTDDAITATMTAAENFMMMY